MNGDWAHFSRSGRRGSIPCQGGGWRLPDFACEMANGILLEIQGVHGMEEPDTHQAIVEEGEVKGEIKAYFQEDT